MAYDFDGVNQRAEYTTLPYADSTSPLTISLWFKPDSTTIQQALTLISSTSHGRIGLEIVANTTTNSGRVQMATFNQFNNGQVAIAPSALTVGEWHHVVGVAASISASNFGTRRVYLNGTAATAVNTANIASTVTLSAVRLGSRKTATPATSIVNYFDGVIAEIGIYTATLEISDISALARGVKPTSVRPDQLAMYLPLVRELDDVCDSRSLSDFNSPTVVPHSRRYG